MDFTNERGVVRNERWRFQRTHDGRNQAILDRRQRLAAKHDGRREVLIVMRNSLFHLRQLLQHIPVAKQAQNEVIHREETSVLEKLVEQRVDRLEVFVLLVVVPRVLRTALRKERREALGVLAWGNAAGLQQGDVPQDGLRRLRVGAEEAAIGHEEVAIRLECDELLPLSDQSVLLSPEQILAVHRGRTEERRQPVHIRLIGTDGAESAHNNDL